MKFDFLSLGSGKIENLISNNEEEQEEFFPNIKEGTITAEETEITLPPIASSLDTTTAFITSEDIRAIMKLYLNEREENKRLQSIIEYYARELAKLTKKHQKLIEETNNTIMSFKEQIIKLTESIRELEEARTRTFTLPESWAIENEEEINDF